MDNDTKTEATDAVASIVLSGEKRVRAGDISDAIKSTGIRARVLVLQNGRWEVAEEDTVIDWRFGFAKVELG